MFTEKQVYALLGAVSFAAAKHDGTHRKNSAKLPYVTHPIGVAQALLVAGVTDLNVLRAAILHDTVEDTETTVAELEAEFGRTTAQLVAEVTDDRSLTQVERKKAQLTRARTCTKDAACIKLADTLNNVESLISDPPRGWSLAKIQGYMVWKWHLLQLLEPANEVLADHLHTIFSGSIFFNGKQELAIPEKPDRAEQLEAYYRLLEEPAAAPAPATALAPAACA